LQNKHHSIVARGWSSVLLHDNGAAALPVSLGVHCVQPSWQSGPGMFALLTWVITFQAVPGYPVTIERVGKTRDRVKITRAHPDQSPRAA